MRAVEVTFKGEGAIFTVVTSINGTDDEIRDYYLGKQFNFGDNEEHPTDWMCTAVEVEFLT